MGFRRRVPKYTELNVLGACSICGNTYLYPDEMVRGPDRSFYCTRTCWHPEWRNPTVLDDSRDRTAHAHRPNRDAPPVPVLPPNWPDGD